MMRSALAVALLVAVLGSACNGTPTSPTAPDGSGPQTPTNPACVPDAPRNLQVAVNGSTRVFTWSRVAGVQDYVIQIGSAPGQSNLLDTNTTQTTYTWTASPGVYYARVYGRNSCGSGPNSTPITFN